MESARRGPVAAGRTERARWLERTTGRHVRRGLSALGVDFLGERDRPGNGWVGWGGFRPEHGWY